MASVLAVYTVSSNPINKVYTVSSENAYGDPDTRQKILTAAQEVIAEQGTSMSVKDVATRAGVSRQAVYLHFADRTGLVIAVVQQMDETLNLGSSIETIVACESGAELIKKTMKVHAAFNDAIDAVALILEGAQYEDEALGAAWRDRMRFRHGVHRAFAQRLAELGELSEEWTVDEAGDLFYATTLVGPWRELTRELGWSEDAYVQRMTSMLARALLT